MSTDPDHDGKRAALTTGALVLLPVLCCGLPLLIAAGALAGLGSVLGNPWVIGATVVLLVAVDVPGYETDADSRRIRTYQVPALHRRCAQRWPCCSGLGRNRLTPRGRNRTTPSPTRGPRIARVQFCAVWVPGADNGGSRIRLLEVV